MYNKDNLFTLAVCLFIFRKMIIGSVTLIILTILIVILVVLAVTAPIYLHLPRFGKFPSGARLERIRRSPNYRDGKFQNLVETDVIVKKSARSFAKTLIHIAFGKKKIALKPEKPLNMVKRDLNNLPADRDLYVWFGHSAYLLSLHGTTVLVDPTFVTASPVSFINKPFAGTDLYKPEDMPHRIDYLVITHDHYDHLDCETIERLKDRVGHVICPLGVGEHLERWGIRPEQLIEMDWNEKSSFSEDWAVFCLPSQHFSGRSFRRDNTLWASFLLETPSGKIFLGCDGGYGPHFREIGEEHPDIDLAILENGQYNEQWGNIHTMPKNLGREAVDLGAKRVITVHHSKYALALHPLDEPLGNERTARDEYGLNLIIAELGEITEL